MEKGLVIVVADQPMTHAVFSAGEQLNRVYVGFRRRHGP